MNLNPVSKLQELMVSEKKSFPQYIYECSGSQPEIKFICTVKVSEIEAVGEGRSKKIAKAIAAENALIQLGHNSSNVQIIETSKMAKIALEEFSENANYTGELHQFASMKGVGYPIYEMPVFCVNGHFKMNCKFQGLETEGYAENKKKAKQIASYKMLEELNNNSHILDKLKAPNVQQIPVGDIIKSSENGISTDIQISSKEQILTETLETSAFNLSSHIEPEIEA